MCWKYGSIRCLKIIHATITIFLLLFAFEFLINLKANFNCEVTQLPNISNQNQDSKAISNLGVTQLPIMSNRNQDSKLEYEKYNLMEETYGRKWFKNKDKYSDFQHCTVEYANAHQLQQNHPCVIYLIKNTYIRQPSSRNLPYKLNYPEIMDPSDGQSKGILRILRNQTNGFFIECGGYDGEYLSNTLFMERTLNWTGLLVEADKKAFHQLSTRNRKAFIAPLCLSTQPYPMEVLFDTTHALLSSIIEKKPLKTLEFSEQSSFANITENVYKIQCFPLYSILLAIGKTEIDYFGLDVEGSEYKILKTIPWHKVNIKTLTVEWDHTPEGEPSITRLMENNKFVKFGHIEMKYSREVLYVKDVLDDLRLYE